MADEQAAYEAGPSEYAAQDDDASGQSEGEITSEKDVILEQDRLLPLVLANIGRIMKNVLPDNGKLSKEAKETMQECVSEFLLFIASEASDICTDDSRKTLSGDDIIQALAKLGFDNYVAPASAYLRKYREATNGKSADGQPTVPATAVYASVSEPVEYAADPKFQHHPQHPQHAQHVQHHILAAGGDQHPQAISLPQHLLQQQQYVPHMQQFQPMPYSVGVQHVQPPTVAGSSVVDPAAVSGTSMAQVLPVDNAAVPRPELREVHPPVQIYHDTQTNRHYLRVSEDNYVPIAFLSNEGAPPQFVAAGQPPPAMVPADVGHPMPPKLSRLAGSLGRSQRTDRRAGNSNVDAGPEQSVGSYLRRQQKEMNPKKRVRTFTSAP